VGDGLGCCQKAQGRKARQANRAAKASRKAAR
jgi:hypothetical protein